MKELTIEEKAKLYDEAKARMSRAYNSNRCTIGFMNEIFPELKESKDEKIRKALISILKSDFEEDTTIFDISVGEIIAWLEKQGKQKPTDKVEPFDKYEGLTDFERTLADICIGWIGEELGWKQYIKDNADILLKIAIKKFNSVQDAPFEQKHAWSEEDENVLKDIKTAVTSYWCEDVEGAILDWLKSLKERYTWKPSEEQMVFLKKCIEAYNEVTFPTEVRVLSSLYNDLKKL